MIGVVSLANARNYYRTVVGDPHISGRRTIPMSGGGNRPFANAARDLSRGATTLNDFAKISDQLDTLARKLRALV
jgi:hypothetical protein